ncbi:unnamed protein product, partial [Amoebophrya sp. A25]
GNQCKWSHTEQTEYQDVQKNKVGNGFYSAATSSGSSKHRRKSGWRKRSRGRLPLSWKDGFPGDSSTTSNHHNSKEHTHFRSTTNDNLRVDAATFSSTSPVGEAPSVKENVKQPILAQREPEECQVPPPAPPA